MALNDREWKVDSWKQHTLDGKEVLVEALVRLPRATGYRRSTLAIKLVGKDGVIDVPIAGFVADPRP
jgi:hypothetical protein